MYKQQTAARPTNNLLSTGRETLDMADAALAELIRQEEKLDCGQKKLATMEDDLDQIDPLIRSIKSFWGQITNAFVPKSNEENLKQFEKEKLNHQSKLNSELNRLDAQYQQNKSKLLKNSLGEESDQDLDEFLGMVSDMKLRASQLNVVIESSNNRLEKMRNTTETVGSKVVRHHNNLPKK